VSWRTAPRDSLPCGVPTSISIAGTTLASRLVMRAAAASATVVLSMWYRQ
jgi:hypothetical protein